MTLPHVAIAGAGPAGLLLAILLASLGVSVTVLEKSSVSDPWSSKSYSINLNPERGLSALDYAGVLEQAKAVGMARHRFVLETADGKRQKFPKDPPHYAFSRPALVDCLEEHLKKQYDAQVTIRRGVQVTKVTETEDAVEVSLDDGSKVTCTHVVGADGKWSAVRNSLPEWKDQFVVQTEPTFGISITPAVNPERWDLQATSVFRPKNPKYYVIAAPLISGQYHASVVCNDEVKEDHPWLVPRGDDPTTDWEAEYGAQTADTVADAEFEEQLAKMLKEEMPQFYEDIHGADSIQSVRVNRRTSWLKPLVENPNYCSNGGRVALVGDAAHGMTPAIGEGCNCALQSALSLVEPLNKDKPVTVEELTQAFMDYGAKRPSEVISFQERSAEGNRYKKSEAASTK